MRVSSHAIQMAARITGIFRKHGISMAYDSPTNQQFVVLSPERYKALKEKVAFEVWEHQDSGNIVCRFVTSWATTDNDLSALDRALEETAQ